MSADLQWSIIRKNSCFLVRSLGTTLTREPNNLTGKNSYSANGLVNSKVLGVSAAEKGVILTTKAKGKLTSKTLGRGGRRTIKTLRAVTAGSYYRPDLTDAAIRKASAIIRSQKTKSAGKRRSRKYKN